MTTTATRWRRTRRRRVWEGEMTDLQRLAAACRAEPDEDTPRLMLADELDALDPVRVQCPGCKGNKRTEHRSADSSWMRSFTYTLYCESCEEGTVIDDTRERWAELIRVQCELAKYEAKPVAKGDYRNVTLKRNGTFYCGDRVAINPLCDREAALLAALDHCRPECPACKGTKLAPESERVGSVPVICSACLHASGLYSTGRIGEWARGGFCVKVPRLADVWVQATCETCNGTNTLRPITSPPCPRCKGERQVWQPTPLGRELAALPLLTEVWCGDRVPYHSAYDASLNPLPYGKTAGIWFDAPVSDAPSHLPGVVYHYLQGGVAINALQQVHPTPDAARVALASAVAQSLAEAGDA